MPSGVGSCLPERLESRVPDRHVRFDCATFVMTGGAVVVVLGDPAGMAVVVVVEPVLGGLVGVVDDVVGGVVVGGTAGDVAVVNV